MNNQDITVSYIVTVYNKEAYVGHTAASLVGQDGHISSEYIFVDDVSTDRSLEAVEAATRHAPNVTIIRNSNNAGPSIRLNQGAKLARGKYLQFMDSDDVLAANATMLMLSLAERHGADVVHGCWERTNVEDAAKLVGRRVRDDAPYIIGDKPQEFVFRQRIRRTMQLVHRDTFLTSGGCDERVFVQDESLGLRLARVARRFLLLKAPVLLIPKIPNVLSSNTAQCNHDRFLASYDMLRDFPDLPELMRRRLYVRCLSSTWKQMELMRGVPYALTTPMGRRYLYSRFMLPEADEQILREMYDFFATVKGIRRVL